ncbi:MAG: alpha/beta fold hydrolase [Chitinophagaceae bacterium]
MKVALQLLKIAAIAYVVLCILLYFIQERLIFFPAKLAKDYQFVFGQEVEELDFKMPDNTMLNGILFRTDKPKGLIFYLHGNAGSLASWGTIAKKYTDLHYDLFMMDYRGYGKSEGSIHNEQQFYEDVQTIYSQLKTRYSEKDIVVLGYSIGTGAATQLAASNHPRLLILQAPYYSLTDMMSHRFRIIPSVLLKYKFATNQFIQVCTMPVVIFHGDLDEVIYYGSSLKLKELFKSADTLITLRGHLHNGMSDDPVYLSELANVLAR